MSLRLVYAKHFPEDVSLQGAWYTEEAGPDVARKYAAAVQTSLTFLSRNPNVGKTAYFKHRELQGLRM
jgi:plasmid stabilization system protein ParE